MKRYIKSTLLVVAGLCWIALALAIGLFLFQYVAGGAGAQRVGFFGVSASTVVLELAQLVGFVAAGCLSFVIGVGLCVHGLVPAPPPEPNPAIPTDASRRNISRAR